MRIHLLFTFALLGFVATTYCQMIPVAPNQYVYLPMNYRKPDISHKYDFTITLKNDSVFTVRTNIDISKKKHFIVVKKNKEKVNIHPEDTKSISRITNYEDNKFIKDGRVLEGIPADSCWLFKSYAGKINCYSFLAETGLYYIIAIQNGYMSPIVPLTKENLSGMIVTDDPKILKMIEKQKFDKAIEAYNTSH